MSRNWINKFSQLYSWGKTLTIKQVARAIWDNVDDVLLSGMSAMAFIAIVCQSWKPMIGFGIGFVVFLIHIGAIDQLPELYERINTGQKTVHKHKRPWMLLVWLMIGFIVSCVLLGYLVSMWGGQQESFLFGFYMIFLSYIGFFVKIWCKSVVVMETRQISRPWTCFRAGCWFYLGFGWLSLEMRDSQKAIFVDFSE